MSQDNQGAMPGASAAPPAPAPEPVSAPAPAAPPSGDAPAAEVAGVVSPSAPADLPATEPPPVIEPVAGDRPAEPALKPHTETEPGLLGADAKPEPPKPDDVPTADKPAEPQAAAEPIVYEAPELPDGVSLDAERLTAANDIFQRHRVSPEAHKDLVQFHVAEMQRLAEQTLQAQHDAFAGVKREWRDAAMGDDEIGGAGLQTSLQTANRMIQLFTTDKSRQPFMDMLKVSGLDSHPEMIRFLVNLGHKFDEPVVSPLPSSPSPDRGTRPGTRGNGSMRSHYDNPRSQEVMSQRR